MYVYEAWDNPTPTYASNLRRNTRSPDIDETEEKNTQLWCWVEADDT